MTTEKQLTHIAGTFVIHADGAFLNGAGLGDGEDRTTTVPKMLFDGKARIPYVSSQSWRRWLRNTVVEEAGWPPSEIRSTKKNAKGNTSKVGSETNPVLFPEDDIFGYMRTAADEKETERKDEAGDLDDDADDAPTGKKEKVKPVMRPSPLASSLLVAIRRGQRQDSIDNGFVHPKDGSPLPYSTKFYVANMQAIFCLDYSRLGVFRNIGDRIELAEEFIADNLKNKAIEITEDLDKKGRVYALTQKTERKTRATALLNALAVLRGGAKQAQFGTDVTPRAIIAAGMSCGNPIFNHLFNDDADGGLTLKIDVLREIMNEFADRIVTPVYIGVRTGFLSNESEVRAYTESVGVKRAVVCTPREAMAKLSAQLP
jgi:CRISPR-associated protein Cst2